MNFGVGADSAEGHEFLQFMEMPLVHEMKIHDGVVVEENCRIIFIGGDAAHAGSQVDHDIGFEIPVHPLDVGDVPEIILGKIYGKDMLDSPLLLQSGRHVRAQNASLPVTTIRFPLSPRFRNIPFAHNRTPSFP